MQKSLQLLTAIFLSGGLFALSLIANFYASVYATESASNSVTDLILSNIPVFDVELLLVAGTLVVIAVFLGVCLYRPVRIPFILYTLATFYFVRSIFVSLTHLGPFPTRIPLDAAEFVTKLFGGADLFFSGHVGVSFLLALLFWHEEKLRYFFLAASVFFGVIVLMGHLHYSIDVAAAFFIAYAIYELARHFFREAYQWMAADFADSASVVK